MVLGSQQLLRYQEVVQGRYRQQVQVCEETYTSERGNIFHLYLAAVIGIGLTHSLTCITYLPAIRARPDSLDWYPPAVAVDVV